MSSDLNWRDYTSLPLREDDFVSIPYHFYKKLLEDSGKLGHLEAYGVDNWEGYDEAMRDFYEEEEG